MDNRLQEWSDRIANEKTDLWVIDCTGSKEIYFSDENPVLNVGGDQLPDEIYLQITQAMASNNVREILIIGWGWWLGDEPPCGKIYISDHIACHSPNPLTGSDDAKVGKAFIDMHKAYEPSPDRGRNVLMWHSFGESITTEEVAVAQKAGCAVASHVIAPWVAGSMKAGLKITAEIACFKK